MSDVPFYGYLRGIIFIFSIIAVGMGKCNGEMKWLNCNYVGEWYAVSFRTGVLGMRGGFL